MLTRSPNYVRVIVLCEYDNMSKTKTSIAQPFLKWAGGKRDLLEQFRPHFPASFNRYYEPFLGGGAVFFGLAPDRAVLSDSNPELINLWRCVQGCPEALLDRLAVHQEQHCEEYYYKVRSDHRPYFEWAHEGISVDRASRLLYLNKSCFNGLYRENSDGRFNVPFGRYKNGPTFDRDAIHAASEALAGIEIRCRGFGSLLDDPIGPGDLVYLDPPYEPVSKTSCFNAYHGGRFDQDAQRRLKAVMVELLNRGAAVLQSNSDCEFIRDLYEGFQLVEIQADRKINSKGGSRGKVKELLILGQK